MTKSWYNIDRYYTSADSRPTKEDKIRKRIVHQDSRASLELKDMVYERYKYFYAGFRL